MVVLVVSYALQQAFLVELVLCHQVVNNLLVEQVGSLRDLVLLAVLRNEP